MQAKTIKKSNMNLQQKIAKESIRELLNKKSNNKIQINKSSIPIRF